MDIMELGAIGELVTIQVENDPSLRLSDFDSEERTMVVFAARSFAQQVEAVFFPYRVGLLDPEVWNVRLQGFASLLRFPAFGEWWNEEQNVPVYTASFLEAVASAKGIAVAPEVIAGTQTGEGA